MRAVSLALTLVLAAFAAAAPTPIQADWKRDAAPIQADWKRDAAPIQADWKREEHMPCFPTFFQECDRLFRWKIDYNEPIGTCLAGILDCLFFTIRQ